MNELLQRLSGALQSPAAQGLAGAAALGFNPLLGLIAAPALAQSRQRAEDNRTAAQLEIEARTEELLRARRQREAQERLPAMLAALSGAQPDAMVGPPRPGQMRTTDARNALLSTLSQAAPQQFTQAAVNQAFPQARQPSRLQAGVAAIREFAGRDPTEAEILQMAGAAPAQENGLDTLLSRLQVEGLLRELENDTAEKEEAAEAEETAQRVETAEAAGLAEEARTVFSKLDALEGTVLDAGSSDSFSGLARGAGGIVGTVLGTIGVDAGRDVRAVTAARDELEKSLSRLRNAAIDQLVPESATNQQRRDAAEGFPTADMEPAAIRSGIRTFAEDQIRRLEAAGADESAIQHFRELLEMMDSVEVEFD